MPSVICPKCKQSYVVNEADNGKECECPCGHEFRIEFDTPVSEMKIAPVSQKLASRKLGKKFKVVVAVCIVCLLAACAAIAIRHDRKKPFGGVINSLEGIEPIKRRSDAIDDYLQAIIERWERDRDLDWALKIYIKTSYSTLRLDELLQLKTQWEKHYNKDANPEKDPLIKDAQCNLAQNEKNLEELSHRVGLSDLALLNALDIIISPIDSVKYIKARNQTVEAQNSLSDALDKHAGNDDDAKRSLMADISSTVAMIKHSESIDDAYFLDKPADEQIAIERKRLERMELNRLKLLKTDKEITNVYSEYYAEVKKQNGDISRLKAELVELTEKKKAEMPKLEYDALVKSIEDKEKAIKEAEQKINKFQGDFKKVGALLIDQQEKIMEAISRRTDEEIRKINHEAKRRRLEEGANAFGIEMTRLMDVLKANEKGRDSISAEIAETDRKIKDAEDQLESMDGMSDDAKKADMKKQIEGAEKNLQNLESLR